MTETIHSREDLPAIRGFQLFLLSVTLLLTLSASIIAQDSFETSHLVVEDERASEVFSHGKTVVVRGSAKGVLSFGGDVIVEGRVTGDVAVIGGSVVQKEAGYIGGDVIIFGGRYLPENTQPLREVSAQTLMYAAYEDELAQLAADPSVLLAPQFSVAFVVQRCLSLIFWFVVSLGVTTIAPGAVSRAAAKVRLTTLRITAVGAAAVVAAGALVISSSTVLPSYVAAVVGMMAFAILVLSYVFGRVVLQVALGKLLLKKLRGEAGSSEVVAILVGSIFWTLLLSLPYLWMPAVFVLFAVGVGLVLTSRRDQLRV